MAFLKIDNVKIAGIAACVPPKRVDNMESDLIEDKHELEKYIETTGVRYRYIAEDGICSSDLCKAPICPVARKLWPGRYSRGFG